MGTIVRLVGMGLLGATLLALESTDALYARWKHDLLVAVPTARVVDLVGANVYMFAPNQDDVLREIRTFVATLPRP